MYTRMVSASAGTTPGGGERRVGAAGRAVPARPAGRVVHWKAGIPGAGDASVHENAGAGRGDGERKGAEKGAGGVGEPARIGLP